MSGVRPWKEGTTVSAEVLGFLPYRRVVLDVNGKTYVACSDLPLVRGERITATARSQAGKIVLKIAGRGEGAGPKGPRARAECDDLDTMIDEAIRRARLAGRDGLRREARRRLLERRRHYPDGVIPLDLWIREVNAAVAAAARGLEPGTPPAAMIDREGGAPIGAALAHLIEALLEAAEELPEGSLLDRYALSIHDRFLPLADPGIGDRLESILREWGVAPTGAGSKMKSSAPAREAVERLLRRLKEDLEDRCRRSDTGEIPRRARSALCRAAAWCTRSLETIESERIGNLSPGSDVPSRRFAQIPLLLDGRAGTLSAISTAGVTRFWIDMRRAAPLSGEIAPGKERLEITLHPPLGKRSPLAAEVEALLRRTGIPVAVEPEGETASITLSRPVGAQETPGGDS